MVIIVKLVNLFVADLSKNRFSELPVEVTEFYFLERLQLYHNTIRSIPDSVVYLQSLIYLDLRWVRCSCNIEIHIKNNFKLVDVVVSYYNNIVGIKATNICILPSFEFIICLQCISISNGVSVL